MATINEAAFEAYFNSEQGEFARNVLQPRTEQVVQLARGKVDDIMHRLPPGEISKDVDSAYDQSAGGFVIGIRNGGEICRYLAEKEPKEQGSGRAWLLVSTRVVFPGA